MSPFTLYVMLFQVKGHHKYPVFYLYFVIVDLFFCRTHDRCVAVQRMQSAGAFLTTTESIIFQLAQTSAHPRFKEISALVKSTAEFANEFSEDTCL